MGSSWIHLCRTVMCQYFIDDSYARQCLLSQSSDGELWSSFSSEASIAELGTHPLIV